MQIPRRTRSALPIDPDVEPGERIDLAPRPLRSHPRVLAAFAERWDLLLAIGFGGSLGAACRWGVETALPRTDGAFPWSTFAVNVTGSLCLGVLMVLVADVWVRSRYLRPFLGVGVLGGYTTYSTYMLELRDLSTSGHILMATGYVLGTLVAGLLAVWLGIVATRSLLARSQLQGRERGRP